MIVVDTEFTSLDPQRGGLWQIGALNLENPKSTFLEEARLEEGDFAEQAALDVVEKSEEELRSQKRQSQKQMLQNFFSWSENVKVKNMVCQGAWDFAYLLEKSYKFGLDFPFHHRFFDLHSVAQTRHLEIKGNLIIDKDHSDMGLNNILKFCGMDDPRKRVGSDGKIVQEGLPHDALSDAKLEAECFSRLMYGRKLLPEFSKFEIPNYLKK